MVSASSHPGVRYAVAVAVVVVAALARIPFAPAVGDTVPFLTFFPAIALVAWAGGFGPTLLATLLSATYVAVVVFPPQELWAAEGFPNRVALAVFVFCG